MIAVVSGDGSVGVFECCQSGNYCTCSSFSDVYILSAMTGDLLKRGAFLRGGSELTGDASKCHLNGSLSCMFETHDAGGARKL